MEELHQSLLTLQELDREIAEAEARLAEFDPKFAELEAPVTALEKEFEATRARLAEMRQEVRRLERAAAEKRDRLRRYEERLERVRNAREEAAARTELDLIRRAAEADEAEALQIMEQVTRTELKLDELERNLGQARAAIEPKRQELDAERAAAASEIDIIRDRRQNHVVRMDPAAAKLYDRVRSGKTKVVVASLTADGACGHCFGVVPLQQQVEIRAGKELIRCEACGVILYPGA